MPQYIVSLNPGKYFIWSTITDVAYTREMSREDMIQYELRFGEYGVDEDLARIQIERRIARADEHGTSSQDPEDTAESMVRFNKMGPKGGSIKLATLKKWLAKEK